MPRIFVSVLIGLLVWVSTGVTVGFVSADDPPSPTFSTEYRVGDQAAYVVNHTQNGESQSRYMELDWIGSAAITAPNGSKTSALELESRITTGDDESKHNFFFVNGQNVLTQFFATETITRQGPLGPETSERQFKLERYEGSMFGLILFASNWAEGSKHDIPGRAILGSFQSNATYDQFDGRIHVSTNLGRVYTYIPGIPFPATMIEGSGELQTTYELVSFVPGGDPLRANHAWTAPSIQMDERTASGPRMAYTWSNHDAHQYLRDEDVVAADDLVTASTYISEAMQETWALQFASGLLVTVRNLDPGLGVPILDHQVMSIPAIDEALLPALLPDAQQVEAWFAAKGVDVKMSRFSHTCQFDFGNIDGNCSHFQFKYAGQADSTMVSWSPDAYMIYETTTFSSRAPAPLTPPREASIPQSSWMFPEAAAASGLGTLGIIAGFLYYFKPALFGLFSRGDTLLEHPARAQIASVIRDQPGLHFQAIRRETNMANGTVRHHLSLLQRANHVSQIKALGKSCYFPRGQREQDMLLAIALKTPGAGDILRALGEDTLSVSDLATRVGASRSTTSHHVARLNDLDLVTVARRGRTTLVTIR